MIDISTLINRFEIVIASDKLDGEELYGAHESRGYLLCARAYDVSLTLEDYNEIVEQLEALEAYNG